MNAKKISIFLFLLLLFIATGYIHYHIPKKSIFLVPDAYIYGEPNDTVLIRVYWIGTDPKEYDLIKGSNLSIVGLDGFAIPEKAGIKETLRYHDPKIKELTFGIYLRLNKIGTYKSNAGLIIENKKENYRKELNIGSWIFEISPKRGHPLKITDMIDLEVGFFDKNVSPECMFAVKNLGTEPVNILGVQYNLSDLQIGRITYVSATTINEIENDTKEIKFPAEGLKLKPNESKVMIIHFKKGDFRYPRKPAVVRFKVLYEVRGRVYAVPVVYTYEIVPIPTIGQLKE